MKSRCEHCEQSFTSRPSSNARFCGVPCYREWKAMQPPPSKAASRKRAQRSVSLSGKCCSKCGSNVYLDRHHHDYQQAINVTILCRKCHRRQDIAEGKQETVPATTCEICHTTFKPKRRRRAKICANPECRAELGKRSARKRWG